MRNIATIIKELIAAGAYYGATAGLAAGNRTRTWIPVGDSITANGNVNNGQAQPNNTMVQHQFQDIGWVIWYNILKKQPWRMLRNAGIAGDTSGQVKDRFDADVVAYKPSRCTLAVGINDVTTGVAGAAGVTTIANLAAICAKGIAAGIEMELCTMLPNATINTSGTTAQREAYAGINTWVRDFAINTKGVVLLDVFESIYDATTLCGARSGMLSDSTHPGTLGAFTIGTWAAANSSNAPLGIPVRASRVDVASATFATGNILGGWGVMTDVTGGLTSGATVQTNKPPTGWWLQGAGDSANCAITHSLVARTDKPGKNWWQSLITFTSSQAGVATFTHRLNDKIAMPSSIVPGTDKVDFEMDFEYLSVTNCGPIEFIIEARDSSLVVLETGKFVYAQSATTPEPPYQGVVPVRGIPVPVGTVWFYIRVIVRNLAATNGGCTVHIGDVSLRKSFA